MKSTFGEIAISKILFLQTENLLQWKSEIFYRFLQMPTIDISYTILHPW